jgi:LPXTG-site transpeptidase (sortase) family protein
MGRCMKLFVNNRFVRLKTINTALLLAIVAVNGYILFVPIYATLAAKPQPTASQVARLEQAIAATPGPASQPTGTGDRLIIPALGFDQPINTGPTAKTLYSGLWLRPNASTPDKGSNTVIVGHRFTYSNPRGIFYYLNTVQVGDHIGLHWQGRNYRYRSKHRATHQAAPDYALHLHTVMATERPLSRDCRTGHTMSDRLKCVLLCIILLASLAWLFYANSLSSNILVQ